jgi:site-specific DNA recombinase
MLTSTKWRAERQKNEASCTSTGAPSHQRVVIELIAKAHDAYLQLTDANIPVSTSERSHLTRLARLKYLAPDISSAILAGQQPADLCARKLLRVAQLPLHWDRQREALGFS